MFSVIIPLYNKVLYVEKAIYSVLVQTYTDFELIIVNDGSTDHSLNVVQNMDFVGYDVKIIDQQNSGVSTTRNNGVKLAKYDYIAFLDADDWWKPTFLEEMKSLIEKYPEAGIYGSSYYIVKNGNKRIAPIGIESDFKEGIINYCQVYAKTLCMPLTSISVVIPKKIFNEKNGFKSDLKFGEDFDLWVRIALKYPVVLLNKPLAYYNQDVDVSKRAVGNLHNPQNHMLLNLEYLAETEKEDRDLKQLLDNLRTYSLYPYYLNKATRETAKKELEKVDWTKQTKYDFRVYHKTPIFALKIRWEILKMGVKIKKHILNLR